MTAWNWVGILAWVLVIALFIWVLHNIRIRRLRMIIQHHQTFAWSNLLLTIGELVVSLGLLFVMFHLTFNAQPKLSDHKSVSVSYHYAPLVVQVGNSGNYYVQVSKSNDKSPVQIYNYWQNGAKYTVSSNKAVVISSLKQFKVSEASYPWDENQLAKLDKQHEKAYVARLTATYKNNFWNGLGIHAGHVATQRWLIRVPAQSFIDVQ